MLNLKIIDNIPCILANKAYKTSNPEAILSLIDQSREKWQALLLLHGAIAFRGFDCKSVDKFSKFIDACQLGKRCSTMSYSIPRTLHENSIYTSSDLPPSAQIALHHEKPRSLHPAHHIYFGCMNVAEVGGETVFANAEKIFLDLPPYLQEKLLNKGVIYKSYYRNALSLTYKLLKWLFSNDYFKTWQTAFKTSSIAEVENQLQRKGYLKWHRNKNDVATSSKLDAIRQHPQTEKHLWFNSADYLSHHSNGLYKNRKQFSTPKRLVINYLIRKDQLPLSCFWGDGSLFSEEEIKRMNETIDKHKWLFSWQKGDLMVVDNYLLMHGKQPHQGERLLYSCMTQMDGQELKL